MKTLNIIIIFMWWTNEQSGLYLIEGVSPCFHRCLNLLTPYFREIGFAAVEHVHMAPLPAAIDAGRDKCATAGDSNRRWPIVVSDKA